MTMPGRTSTPRYPAQALAPQQSVTTGVTLLSDEDLYYFNEGTHSRLYEKLGAHPLTVEERRGTYFAGRAPNAAQVGVMGHFNGWGRPRPPLPARGRTGPSG